MRLKILAVLCLMCLCAVTVAVAADQSSTTDAEMTPALMPKTTQVVGDTEAKLGPSTYPMFYDFQGGNEPECETYLKKQFAVQTGDENDGVANSGMTLAPIYLKSAKGNGYTGGPKQDYVKIPGLEVKGYEIPEEYRAKAGVLVTWTVRIEGAQTAPYGIQGKLCSPNWSGTSFQSYPGGEVKTKLYVTLAKGTSSEVVKPLGQEACMTIPDAGKNSITDKPKPPPGDPTHTGSYLITAKDFEANALPAMMDLEIRWLNETCQELTSPAKMRSVIITLMPDADKEQK